MWRGGTRPLALCPPCHEPRLPSAMTQPAATRPERLALKGFGVFTVVALIGYGSFGVDPARLAFVGPLGAVYTVAFPVFARAHIVLAASVLAVTLIGRTGPRWVGAAVAALLLSLGAELIGTNTGWPFGPYRYSGLLGWKVAGHVPALVPLSWFLMALPAYLLAAQRFEGRSPVVRILWATAALVVWDLALDPAMSRLAPYWIWEESGSYYGMPWINLVGWAVTGAAIMTAFVAVGVDRWADRLPGRWLAAYYGVTLAMPLGMVAAAGLWGAVALTVLCVGLLATPWLTLAEAFPAPRTATES